MTATPFSLPSAPPGRLDIRLRVPTPGLLGLPWLEPLLDWSVAEVPLRDLPVGPSRHLVRFVETDGALWALKELPVRIAVKEYNVLRELESRELPSVRAAGIVVQPFPDTAILVTRYLARSWQYRRLLMRTPMHLRRHRERLLDAMALLLVDLHRAGVFWGDCSLANTLFTRDGQLLQAWLVDAETSEIHPQLSNGQRAQDLDILVENVAGGLLDLAVRLEQPEDTYGTLMQEAFTVAERYRELWALLHAEPTVEFSDRYSVDAQLRRLYDLGFGVDEVHLEPTGDAGGAPQLRLRVAVTGRHYHSDQLRRLTGLEVGEGQASILLNDFRSFQARHCSRTGDQGDEQALARRWLSEVVWPLARRAHAAERGVPDVVQAYCDLLEVRWLMSERAGRDVGDEEALRALQEGRGVPLEAAAVSAVAEAPTSVFRALTPEMLAALDANRGHELDADERGDLEASVRPDPDDAFVFGEPSVLGEPSALGESGEPASAGEPSGTDEPDDAQQSDRLGLPGRRRRRR